MADQPSTAELRMCSVADWIGGDECLRVAQWRVEPPDEHPVFLCNFHAEPFVPLGNYGRVSRADAE